MPYSLNHIRVTKEMAEANRKLFSNVGSTPDAPLVLCSDPAFSGNTGMFDQVGQHDDASSGGGYAYSLGGTVGCVDLDYGVPGSM